MLEDSSILGSLPSSKESLLGLEILVVLPNMCGEAAQEVRDAVRRLLQMTLATANFGL